MTDQNTELTTVDEVVSFLKERHTAIKEMLPSVLQASGAERATAFANVRQTLAVHEAFEQVVVHPHAQSDAGNDVVAERVEEEEEAGDAISELERLNVDDPDFHDAYAAFMLDVVEHAEHEEHEEFGRISHEFTAEELDQITRGVELTLAEADAPASQLTFADMLTNAKQMISAGR